MFLHTLPLANLWQDKQWQAEMDASQVGTTDWHKEHGYPVEIELPALRQTCIRQQDQRQGLRVECLMSVVCLVVMLMPHPTTLLLDTGHAPHQQQSEPARGEVRPDTHHNAAEGHVRPRHLPITKPAPGSCARLARRRRHG